MFDIPHTDVCMQSKALLNKTPIRIRLTRSDDAFLLMSSKAGAKVEITHMSIQVRMFTLSDPTRLAHERALMRSTANYPIQRTMVNLVNIAAGTRSEHRENIITGAIPEFVAIGLVENVAMSGNVTKNPLKFAHHNLSSIQLSVNGKPFPNQPMKLDYVHDNYLEGFNSLFSATGTLFQNNCPKISREAYANGYALYCFDLTADGSVGQCKSGKQSGSVTLDLHFDENLTTTLTVVIYSVYHNNIKIDLNRHVTIDY